MDMRTDVNAVPHAGLGFHFLRVPVGNHLNPGGLQKESKAQKLKKSRSAIRSKMTAFRACLRLLKYQVKTSEHRGSWLKNLPSGKWKIKQVHNEGVPHCFTTDLSHCLRWSSE